MNAFAPHTCLVPTGVRRCWLDPLELEFQMFVKLHVGLETEPRQIVITAKPSLQLLYFMVFITKSFLCLNLAA